MPQPRKKPCSICRHWFLPDPRVGARQRACGKAECQATRRQRTQARWRTQNPDYFIAHRMQVRSAQDRTPEPLRLSDPLSQLPWDVAQDQFGVQGADFLGVMGRLLLTAQQDQFRGYVADSTVVADTLRPSPGQDQTRLAPD